MNWTIKTFDELTVRELYELLRLRTEVFVVEQNCAYQEIDGVDTKSLHVFLAADGGRITAYLRLFPRETAGTVQMGRVVVAEERRGTGLGRALLREGIRTAETRMGADTLVIEAQTYAVGFYAREGFRVCSEEFLEDGIPHVRMIRDGRAV